ncbi:MAG: DpnD/PcfM family protein [Lachnospiraceae bacterium]|nr:DpnD/PcfM family protein [Lachnospiraceae bacterium]
MVAVDAQYCFHYPYAGEHTKENAEVGIEWGHGVYLSATPSEIDFVALRTKYCEPYRQQGNEFSIEIREVLSRVEKVPADTLGDAIDDVMDMYKRGEIVLDADDYEGVSYVPVSKDNR